MTITDNFDDLDSTTSSNRPFTFPMKERIRTMRLQQAEHAILELRDMGVIELKKPLSFWREELVFLEGRGKHLRSLYHQYRARLNRVVTHEHQFVQETTSSIAGENDEDQGVRPE